MRHICVFRRVLLSIPVNLWIVNYTNYLTDTHTHTHTHTLVSRNNRPVWVVAVVVASMRWKACIIQPCMGLDLAGVGSLPWVRPWVNRPANPPGHPRTATYGVAGTREREEDCEARHRGVSYGQRLSNLRAPRTITLDVPMLKKKKLVTTSENTIIVSGVNKKSLCNTRNVH